MTLFQRVASLRPAVLVVIAAAVIGGMTVLFSRIVMDIEREYLPEGPASTADAGALQKPVVFLGVISRYPPTVMYRGYQPMMDYLTSTTPYRFELMLSQDYNDALEKLLSRKASAVFLGSYLYTIAHHRHGVIPILKPLNANRQPFSRSVLFVKPGSDIQNVRNLAGRKIALPSRESFSSHWILDAEIPHSGLRVKDLAQVQHLPHHHTVIAQVLNGTYDAGVTREHLVRDLFGTKLRPIVYSKPIPSSPLAVHAKYDTSVVQAITSAFLRLTNDDTTRARVTRDWDAEFVHGFVAATDADYEIIRSIAASLPERRKTP